MATLNSTCFPYFNKSTPPIDRSETPATRSRNPGWPDLVIYAKGPWMECGVIMIGVVAYVARLLARSDLRQRVFRHAYRYTSKRRQLRCRSPVMILSVNERYQQQLVHFLTTFTALGSAMRGHFNGIVDWPSCELRSPTSPLLVA